MNFYQFILLVMVAAVIIIIRVISIIHCNRPFVKSYDSYLQLREGLSYMRNRGYKAVEIRVTEVVYQWDGKEQ